MKEVSSGRLAAALAVLAVAAGAWWGTWQDADAPGTAVLGGYRDRWFLFNCAITWLASWAAVALVLRPAREVWFRVVGVHFGLGLLLVFLEATALIGLVDFRDLLPGGRAYASAGARVHPEIRNALHPDQVSSGVIVQDLVPILGAEADTVQFTFETDGEGLRNADAEARHSAAILCLGDSILVAGLVPLEQLVTTRLEDAVGMGVYNISGPGWSPQEGLRRLDALALDLADREVVHFIFEGNDLKDSKAWRQWVSASEATRRNGYPASGVVKALLAQMHRPKKGAGLKRSGLFDDAEAGRVRVYFFYDGPSNDAAMGELEHVMAALESAADSVRASGGRYRIVLVPAKLSVMGGLVEFAADSDLADPSRWASRLAEELGAFAARTGIPFLDLTPTLKRVARQEGRLPYYPADTHLNAVGHAAMAEAIAAWLRAESTDGALASGSSPPPRRGGRGR